MHTEFVDTHVMSMLLIISYFSGNIWVAFNVWDVKERIRAQHSACVLQQDTMHHKNFYGACTTYKKFTVLSNLLTCSHDLYKHEWLLSWNDFCLISHEIMFHLMISPIIRNIVKSRFYARTQLLQMFFLWFVKKLFLEWKVAAKKKYFVNT